MMSRLKYLDIIESVQGDYVISLGHPSFFIGKNLDPSHPAVILDHLYMALLDIDKLIHADIPKSFGKED